MGPYPRSALTIEPGGDEPPPIVVAEVRRVVLEGAVPDAHVYGRRHLHVVLLLGEVALDLEDQLLALGEVRGPALADEQVGHDGVIEVALVLELTGVVLAVEVV